MWAEKPGESGSEAVSGVKNYGEAGGERGARGRAAGTERRAGVTKIDLSGERTFRHSHALISTLSVCSTAKNTSECVKNREITNSHEEIKMYAAKKRQTQVYRPRTVGQNAL